jgi:hypothetical protein
LKNDRVIIGAFLVFQIAILTALVFGFLTASPDDRLLYVFLLGIPIAAVFLAMPRVALVLLGILVYSIDWLSETWNVVPREGTWVIDILILVLLGRTIIHRPFCKHPHTKIEIVILVSLGLTAISAIFNQTHYTSALIGLRIGYRFLGLFLAIYHLGLSYEWIRKYLLYLLFPIGLVQTLVVLIQAKYFGTVISDDLCGTFGHNQSAGVAIFLTVLFCYLISKMIEEHQFRISYLLIILWMTISPVLGEVKFYFLSMPILIMFMVRTELIRRPMLGIGLLLLGMVLIFSADYFVVRSGIWMEGRNPITYVQRIPEVFESEMEVKSEGVMERFYSWFHAARIAASSPKLFVLGAGPGAITQSFVSASHSERAAFYLRWGITSSRPTIPYLVTEYGYVGLLIFFYLLYLIFRRGRILRQSPEIGIRVFGRSLESITFLYGSWCFYTSSWQIDTQSFIYWSLAGMLVALSYQVELSAKKAEALQRVQEARSPVPMPAFTRST